MFSAPHTIVVKLEDTAIQLFVTTSLDERSYIVNDKSTYIPPNFYQASRLNKINNPSEFTLRLSQVDGIRYVFVYDWEVNAKIFDAFVDYIDDIAMELCHQIATQLGWSNGVKIAVHGSKLDYGIQHLVMDAESGKFVKELPKNTEREGPKPVGVLYGPIDFSSLLRTPKIRPT